MVIAVTHSDDMLIAAQSSSPLADRWNAVLHGVAEAVRTSGRVADDVQLIAVSKHHSASAVATLALLGQKAFGENYMQEARAKQVEVAELLHVHGGLPSVCWHAIGAIQSNKAKDAAGHFALIHTLASTKLALKLAEALGRCHASDNATVQTQDALIQVNIGEEPQKAGVLPAELPALAESLLAQQKEGLGVRVLGLMCLPPRCGEGELARPYFSRLRELRDDLERRTGQPLPHLSMGMSGDYHQAIAEGATLVRVGTDIFGSRPTVLR